MKTIRLIVLIGCTTLLAQNVGACGMHGGFGGGAFGMEWQPYDPNADYSSYGDESSDDTSSEAPKRARPVFSSSAQRSSDTAKAKLANRNTDTDSVDEDGDEE